MNLSVWGIRNPVPVVFLFVVLSVWGLMAYNRLPVQSFPRLDVPTITVRVALEGGSVGTMERDVAEPLEAAVRDLSGLDRVSATVAEGYVAMTVAFVVGTDPRDAESDVRAAVSGARSDLPAAAEEPTIARATFPSTVLEYAIVSDAHGVRETTAFVDAVLAPAIRRADGVASVQRTGGTTEELRVDFDPIALAGAGLDLGGAARQIEGVIASASGGSVTVGGFDASVAVEPGDGTLESLERASLTTSTGPVPLRALARLSLVEAEVASVALLDGKPVVLLSILRGEDASDGDAARSARDVMETVLADNPGYTALVISDTAEETDENHSISMAMLYEGALIAIVVVFLFLRNWRATLVAATALPLSILPTFGAMEMMGFTLNTVSLLALSLVVGVLVDDAIVEVENVERHLAMGKDPKTAAGDAATEIGMAVIATTLTLVAVFLPTAFMPGIPGLIFQQFGATAAVAVLFSLLVARVLTPMMAASMMKPPKGGHVARIGRVGRAYARAVRWTLLHPLKTLGVGALTVAGGVYLATHIPTGFFPPSASDRVSVSISAPAGTGTDRMIAHAQGAVAVLEPAFADATGVLVTVGIAQSSQGPGDSGGGGNSGTASIVGMFEGNAPAGAQRMATEAAASLPGLRVQVGGGGQGTQVSFAFEGERTEDLDAATAAFATELRAVPGIGTVRAESDVQKPRLVARLRANDAARLGVSASTVAQTLRAATTGGLGPTLPLVPLPGGDDAPVRAGLAATESPDPARLGAILVSGAQGLVRLDAVADVVLEGTPASVSRTDGQRRAVVVAELGTLALGEATAAAQALPSLQRLPGGVSMSLDGEGRQMAELLSGFATAMGIGILCIYGVLVLLFHGFVRPFAILVALPLSIGGALLPLAIFGMSFSMPALIGALMLMGIVTKNSILIIERAVENEKRQGMNAIEALVEACTTRARPIVMTTVAMVGGMIPVALSLHGGESSFRQPMGAVVIGGLLASTALSLLFVPAFSLILDRSAKGVHRLLFTPWWRRKAAAVSPKRP